MNDSTLTPEEFYDSVMRTANTNEDVMVNFQNILISLLGEIGEFANVVKKKVFHQHAIPNNDFLDELGDILFYYFWLTDAIKGAEALRTAEFREVWLRKFHDTGLTLDFSLLLKSLSSVYEQCVEVARINYSLQDIQKNALIMFTELNKIGNALKLEGCLAQAASYNRAKLLRRYPRGYSHEASVKRSDETNQHTPQNTR
jgi:NTP pyrophosphatase (non-canonical NTP hydrolase)